MLLKWFTVVLLVSCCISVKAYRIECNFFGLNDGRVKLARYEGKKLFAVEEMQTDKNGIVIFESDEQLPCGLYVFILRDTVSFELFIPPEGQDFQIFADYGGVQESLRVKGNEVVSRFVAYQKAFVTLSKQQRMIRKRLLNNFSNRDSVQYLKKENKRMDRMREKTENNYINNNEDNELGQYVYWSQRLQDSLFQDHAAGSVVNDLENMPLPSECLVNTPLFEVFMEAFYNVNEKLYFLDQQMAIDILLEQFPVADQRYRFALTYLYNAYNDPNDPEKEAVFYYLAQQYYLEKKPEWVPSSLIQALEELSGKENITLLGKPFPPLHKKIDRSLPDLSKSDEQLNWLVFVKNDCKSCLDVLEKLEDTYKDHHEPAVYVLDLGDKITTNRLSVFPKSWQISNHFLHSEQIMNMLEIKRVPRIYVLDDEQVVLAKGNTYREVERLLQKRKRKLKKNAR